MTTLTIDTTTPTLIIGIFQTDKQIDTYEQPSKNDHASILMPAIETILHKNNLQTSDITKIIVNNGPGSYTGTRIGVTTSKTLGWALNIPVQAISALHIYANNAKQQATYISPLIDARRQAVYTALYRKEHNTLTNIENEQHTPLKQWLETLKPLKKELVIISPETDQIQAHLPKGGGWIVESTHMSAQALYDAAKQDENKELPHIHQIVPNYLRLTEAEQNLLKQNGANKHD